MSYSATTSSWQPVRAATVNVHFHNIGHRFPDALDQSDGTIASAVLAADPPVIVSLTDVLYLQEPGTSAPISPLDINQGQMGDCFLCSSMGELAMWDPSAISNMIQDNGNGTETVTLYLAANGSLPTFGTTSFEATTVTVNNNFPSNSIDSGATQDVYNGEKEILAAGAGRRRGHAGRRLQLDRQRRQSGHSARGTDGDCGEFGVAGRADAVAVAGGYRGQRPDRHGYRPGQRGLRALQRPRLHVRGRDHGERRASRATAQSVGVRRSEPDSVFATRRRICRGGCRARAEHQQQ